MILSFWNNLNIFSFFQICTYKFQIFCLININSFCAVTGSWIKLE
ncbi:MAG: DUF3709 domain-containing protein [Halanaerobium sp.]